MTSQRSNSRQSHRRQTSSPSRSTDRNRTKDPASRLPYVLGSSRLTDTTVRRDSSDYLGGNSIAMGHPVYEMYSAPQPLEPLSHSPTEAYAPWEAKQERVLHVQSSRSRLVPSRRGSAASSSAYHGSNDHQQHRDYWDQSALQPSAPTFDSEYEVKVERPSQFTTADTTDEAGGGVSKTRLYEYGLHDAQGKKTLKFWTLILAFSVTVALTALDMTMISTALPSIVKDLPTSTIAGGWVTSSYLLTVTAFQPLFGGLSCVIGRRWSVVLAVLLFIGGSVLCGCANSILLLVVGRGVQGLGGGGIQAIGEIIISDITTLRERGFFVGIFGLVFAVASFVAPVLGGYFSDHDWRWIFWINIPIGTVALIMLIPTLNLPVPSMPLSEKFARMDVFGNLVLLGSVVSILIAVTEGGVSHPWSSAHSWVPMVAGLVGFFLFLVIEFVPNPLSTQPVLPLRLFSNRTACSAFLMTFLHGIATYGAIYALPLFFQAIHDQKPLKSAVSTFPSTAPSAPFAIAAGIIMAITGKYKDLTFIGWAFTAGGFGWMTRFQIGTSDWELIVAQIITGVGIGILFAITLPPIQASLPIEELETATATYAFCRSFGAIWGIAITTSVLTSSVSDKLASFPEAAKLGLTGPTVLGYVESIKDLPEPMRDHVRKLYADGLQKAMYLFMPVVIAGFACCFWIRDLPLPDFIREDNEGEKHIDTDRPRQASPRETSPRQASPRQQQGAERASQFRSPTPTFQSRFTDNRLSSSNGDHSHDTTLVSDNADYRKVVHTTYDAARSPERYTSNWHSSPSVRTESAMSKVREGDLAYGRITALPKAYKRPAPLARQFSAGSRTYI